MNTDICLLTLCSAYTRWTWIYPVPKMKNCDTCSPNDIIERDYCLPSNDFLPNKLTQYPKKSIEYQYHAYLTSSSNSRSNSLFSKIQYKKFINKLKNIIYGFDFVVSRNNWFKNYIIFSLVNTFYFCIHFMLVFIYYLQGIPNYRVLRLIF